MIALANYVLKVNYDASCCGGTRVAIFQVMDSGDVVKHCGGRFRAIAGHKRGAFRKECSMQNGIMLMSHHACSSGSWLSVNSPHIWGG